MEAVRQPTAKMVHGIYPMKGEKKVKLKKASMPPALQILPPPPRAAGLAGVAIEPFADVVVLRDKANRAPRKNRRAVCERCRQERLDRRQREPCGGMSEAEEEAGMRKRCLRAGAHLPRGVCRNQKRARCCAYMYLFRTTHTH